MIQLPYKKHEDHILVPDSDQICIVNQSSSTQLSQCHCLDMCLYVVLIWDAVEYMLAELNQS